ncbi:hypothetical protein JB92DRAFT_2929028 [Gautieria morchelliformis]|nr:hypothetical protein JB92DRAFT_2929028 [Gautieria morchelliformis]
MADSDHPASVTSPYSAASQPRSPPRSCNSVTARRRDVQYAKNYQVNSTQLQMTNTRRRLSLGSAGMDQDGKPPRHVFININDASGVQAIDTYIYEIKVLDGSHRYFCTCSHNAHPGGFHTRHDVVSHIRGEHFQGKSFLCTAWFEPTYLTCWSHVLFSSSNTAFTRKQDAVRHVTTKNDGKKYKCSVCHKVFSRKDYRDGHETRCLDRPHLRSPHTGP